MPPRRAVNDFLPRFPLPPRRVKWFVAAGVQNLFRTHPLLATVPVEAPLEETLSELTAESGEQLRLVRTWNRAGGLLRALAVEAQIETSLCVAAVCFASPGEGLASDKPRLELRFEPHIFFIRWGSLWHWHRRFFRRYFRFNRRRSTTGHYFRRFPVRGWVHTHRSHSTELEALKLARRLNDTEALCSTAMGFAHIMGFHYALLGFSSVQKMFGGFADPANSVRTQVLSFFDFLRRALPAETLLNALRDGDVRAFVKLYCSAFDLRRNVERFRRYRAEFEARYAKECTHLEVERPTD